MVDAAVSVITHTRVNSRRGLDFWRPIARDVQLELLIERDGIRDEIPCLPELSREQRLDSDHGVIFNNIADSQAGHGHVFLPGVGVHGRLTRNRRAQILYRARTRGDDASIRLGYLHASNFNLFVGSVVIKNELAGLAESGWRLNAHSSRYFAHAGTVVFITRLAAHLFVNEGLLRMICGRSRHPLHHTSDDPGDRSVVLLPTPILVPECVRTADDAECPVDVSKREHPVARIYFSRSYIKTKILDVQRFQRRRRAVRLSRFLWRIRRNRSLHVQRGGCGFLPVTGNPGHVLLELFQTEFVLRQQSSALVFAEGGSEPSAGMFERESVQKLLKLLFVACLPSIEHFLSLPLDSIKRVGNRRLAPSCSARMFRLRSILCSGRDNFSRDRIETRCDQFVVVLGKRKDDRNPPLRLHFLAIHLDGVVFPVFHRVNSGVLQFRRTAFEFQLPY